MVEEWVGEVVEVDGEAVVAGEDLRAEDTAAGGMEVDMGEAMVAAALGMAVEVVVMVVATVGGEVEWEVEDDDRKWSILGVDQGTRYRQSIQGAKVHWFANLFTGMRGRSSPNHQFTISIHLMERAILEGGLISDLWFHALMRNLGGNMRRLHIRVCR